VNAGQSGELWMGECNIMYHVYPKVSGAARYLEGISDQYICVSFHQAANGSHVLTKDGIYETDLQVLSALNKFLFFVSIYNGG